MREGRSGIGPIVEVPTELTNVKIAAQVRGFDAATHFDAKRLAFLDRVSQFALIAAREAVAQAGLDFREAGRGDRTACIVGTGVGGEITHDEQSQRFYADKNPRLHPLTIVRLMPNAPASQVSIEFGISGPAFGVVSACASSNHAMAQAFGVSLDHDPRAVAMLQTRYADGELTEARLRMARIPAGADLEYR